MVWGQHVIVKGWPFEARLQAWGRATASGWWGLIVWEARVRFAGTPERVWMSAWVPAARLSKPHWASHERLQRLQLPANRLDWPPPLAGDGYFFHAWDAGELPGPLPDGLEIQSGPAWQAD